MEVVASAPGKVLLTGGYLILERPNAGLVLSTTARFYAIVRPLYEAVKPESWAWSWTDIKVTSPQLSREFIYKLCLKNSTLQSTASRDSSNPFVEQAVQLSVAAAKSTLVETGKKDVLHNLLLQGLDITILGSNDFYSFRNQIEAMRLPLTPEVLATLPAFSSTAFNLEEVSNGTAGGEICKPEVSKTGLGSSAAMTTSVVAALLHYFGVVNLPFPQKTSSNGSMSQGDLDLVHMIAQSAHCLAQGKIGSGFDVSAAVYGSQRYVRFSPNILSSAQGVDGKFLPGIVDDILHASWDQERLKFSLPPLLTLLLGEPGSGGSSTPSMVGSVKRWQQSDPQSFLEIQKKLQAANSALEEHLKMLNRLADQHWDSYKSFVAASGNHPHGKWVELVTDQFEDSVVKCLRSTRDAFLEIRFCMREMGKAADVPIEPESQSKLLDVTMDMNGVLLAGIPGAGGFDAIFAVVLGDEASSSVSAAWSVLGVLPLLVREDPRGVSLENSDPRASQLAASVSSIRIN